jgi:hypothetical protein
MKLTQRPATRVVIRCRNDHDSRLTIDDVVVVHTDGHVAGLRFDCPRCSTTNHIVSSAQVAAVVHAFGAPVGTTSTPIESTLAADPQHQIVSLRVLLDDPDVIGRFAESPRRDVVEDVEIDAET